MVRASKADLVGDPTTAAAICDDLLHDAHLIHLEGLPKEDHLTHTPADVMDIDR